MSNRVKKGAIACFCVIGLIIIVVAGYYSLREYRILKMRDAEYDHLIQASASSHHWEAMNSAKKYFSKRPMYFNTRRERQVLTLYENSLKYWVAKHINESDEKLKTEIEMFQSIAAKEGR